MKKILSIITICLAMAATPLWAHHAAEGMVDEEVYAMIDSMIADTPHGDMVLAVVPVPAAVVAVVLVAVQVLVELPVSILTIQAGSSNLSLENEKP